MTQGSHPLAAIEFVEYTPVLTASGGGNYTLTAAAAIYAKNGRLVHVQGLIVVNVATAPLGQAKISLPFPIAASLSGWSAANFLLNNFAASFTGTPLGVCDNGQVTIDLYEFAAGVASSATAAKVINGSVLVFAAEYVTD